MNDAGGTFAGYRIDELLATDTVSSIYRATPQRSPGARPRPVALRVTHPLCDDDGPDVDAIATYIRRVSAALKINHSALTPIVDAGDTEDRVYVATALIDGVTLGHHLRDRGPLSVRAAVAMLRDLAEGLDRAHAAGLVHGAISPRTIAIRQVDGRSPTAVVRGFGIDTLLTRQARIDRDTIDLHDVQYVAPEQLQGAAVEAASDEYALACALYHCIAGVPPFTRETASGMFGAHLFSIASPHPAPDRPLPAAVLTGLEKRPDARHGSCGELLSSTDRSSSAAGHGAETPQDDVAGARVGTPGGDRTHTATRPRRSAPAAPVQGSTRRARRRRRHADGRRSGRERPSAVTWPVAAMMVLIGIITTLVLVSLVRQRGPADESGDADAGSGAADGALAASGDTPADAGVSWQRTLTDEPLYDLRVVGDTVVAAAPHTVMTLEVDGGTGTWRRSIDVGVLTDVAVTDKTVALRAATFRAVSLDAGTERWDKPDIVAPISSLAARDGVIYGIGPGRLSPELVALEASTGVPVWYYDGGAAAIADDATVAVDHGIVGLLDDTGVAVIDPGSSTSVADDGRVAIDDARWRANVVDPWPGSLALLPDAIVVATRAGRVCAYDPADGALRWCMPVAGLAEQQPTLLVDGDTIVVVLESTVTALALESGLPRWTFEAQRALTPIAASTGREVVVSDVSGRAYGLDLDRGIQTWRASGFGEITALTATADAIYAGTRAGVIVRLQPPVDGVPS